MKKQTWIKEQYPWLILGAVLLMLALLNGFFLDHWIDSDMAAEMMFSKLLAQEGHLFGTTNWYYSTEFRVLYTQLLMVPLFHLTQNWHLIRFLTNMIFYIILLISYFYLAGQLHCDRKKTILCASALLLPFSETLMLHMEIGNTYISHVILLFFYFGIFMRITGNTANTDKVENTETSGRPARNTTTLRSAVRWFFFLALAFVFGLSGVRYMLAMQAPLILAALFYLAQGEAFQSMRSNLDLEHLRFVCSGERWRKLVISLIGTFCTLAGYAVNVLVISHRYTFQTYEGTNFIDVYQGIFMDRLQDTFGSLLMLFGYIPGKSVLSLRGVITLAAFLMIFLLGYCALQCRKTAVEEHRFLVLFFFCSFWLNTFIFVFTKSTIVPRYYITSVAFLVPIMAIYLTEEKRIFDRRAISCLLVICLGLATLKTAGSMAVTDKNADRYGALTYLEEQNLHFGYATYWNGNILQELSDGQVETANIKDPESFAFFKWSSQVRYYDPSYASGRVFVLLTTQEAQKYRDCAVLQAGQKAYEDSAFTVYVYASNEELLNHVEKQ